jgi:hypothetical protein
MKLNKVIFSDTPARKHKFILQKRENIKRVKNDSKNEIKLPDSNSIIVNKFKLELCSSGY